MNMRLAGKFYRNKAVGRNTVIKAKSFYMIQDHWSVIRC